MPIGGLDAGLRITKKRQQGVGLFGFSWIAANFLPFAILAYLTQRWVYPFYFYMSLPGLYIGLTHYMTHSRGLGIALPLLVCMHLFWFLVWFPVKPMLVIDLLLLLGLPA